jgi:hypothetical protein
MLAPLFAKWDGTFYRGITLIRMYANGGRGLTVGRHLDTASLIRNKLDNCPPVTDRMVEKTHRPTISSR